MVLDAFATMANAREASFDWFDAAVMSYQMGRHLEHGGEQWVGEVDNRQTVVGDREVTAMSACPSTIADSS